MTSNARKILDAALSLDAAEREEIVSALSASLAQEAVRLSPAWTAELAKRIDEIERGEVTPVTLDEVERRISARLAR